MVDRNKELAINTVILGIGQLIPKFLAIMLLPLLTSYLTTEEYGNYDLILCIASCNHANTASSISLLACIEER